MLNNIYYSIFVVKGSIPGQIIVSDESLYYVYREIWQGRALLDTRIHGSFVDKSDADARATQVQKEYTFD